jgi:hypothetical protein
MAGPDAVDAEYSTQVCDVGAELLSNIMYRCVYMERIDNEGEWQWFHSSGPTHAVACMHAYNTNTNTTVNSNFNNNGQHAGQATSCACYSRARTSYS